VYKVLDEDTIKNDILPHSSVARRGFICTGELAEVVNAILYKLKTGCQWAYLPVESLFSGIILSWQSVFHSLLNRLDVTVPSWLNFNQIALMVIFLRKINKEKRKSSNHFIQ